MKKNIILFALIILAAIAILVGIAYVASQNLNQGDQYGSDTIGIETEGEDNYTIEEVPVSIEEIAPDPNRPIQFSENIPQEVRTSLNAKAEVSAARIEEDITKADEWFNLALYYHTANDFEGARAIWEFLATVIPDSAVALDNLGKLHHYSLREFEKAEDYFMRSIERDPSSITPYLELHELYRFSYKTETNAGAEIIEDAIDALPGMIELYVTLGSYYRDRGQIDQARTAFTTGLNVARDTDNVDLIAVFGNELARLPAQN